MSPVVLTFVYVFFSLEYFLFLHTILYSHSAEYSRQAINQPTSSKGIKRPNQQAIKELNTQTNKQKMNQMPKPTNSKGIKHQNQQTVKESNAKTNKQ